MLTRIARRRIIEGVCVAENHTPTVESQQIATFNELSPNWWDENGTMKPLHAMNKIRVPFIRDGLINTGITSPNLIDTPQPLKNLSILEVGCGGGILSEPLARLGCSVTGIDVASELLQAAEEHKKQDSRLCNLHYQLSTIEEHAASNSGKYDAVVASEVIEHVAQKDQFVESCVACVKPKGSIFITTLNQTMLTWVFGIVISENILNLIPKGTHEWDKLMQPHRLQKLVEDNGCRTRAVHGMFYNVLTNNWSWISDTSISYALHAIKS
ncbi:hypothetical protein FQR65_LT06902 [Abscondita terminalis]|nr:hypothetical protein FQR65_LT06902 [Abscondita terminalis]